MAVFEAYQGFFSRLILPLITCGGKPPFNFSIMYFSSSLSACISLHCSRALWVRAYALCWAFLGSYRPWTLFLLISRETAPWFRSSAFAISRPLYFFLRSIPISLRSLLEKRENFFLPSWIQSYSDAIQNGNSECPVSAFSRVRSS